MGSATYAAYQAILTRNDAALATVFGAAEPVVDLFELVSRPDVSESVCLVFDDRTRFPGATHARRWRPSVVVSAELGLDEMPLEPGTFHVLSDAAFPAAITAVPADLVIPAGPHRAACNDAVNLIAMVRNFAGGYASLVRQGATDEQIVGHPTMRELAAIIHARSVQFSSTWREGIQLDARTVPPPPGARQLPPARWLERNAREPQITAVAGATSPAAPERAPRQSPGEDGLGL